MKLLILFGHPAIHHSKINKQLIRGMHKLDNVTFHDLYENYPDFMIDIDKEQELLKLHDCIAFMFPLYWYSSPSIFKEWQDLVLEHGWAYGSKGNELKNKLFFCIISAGGVLEMYQEGGVQNHPIGSFLLPYQQMATMCKMITLPPFITDGGHDMNKKSLNQFQEKLHETIKAIASNRIDINKTRNREYLNDYITIEN